MPLRDSIFDAVWSRFTRLDQTVDLLPHALPAISHLPIISFIVPVTDEVVLARCRAWQEAFGAWLTYDPQPPDRLHITLHYMGSLRRHFWQWRPTTWRRAALPKLAERVGAALADVPAFDVTVGPLNAFPTALFAEVHDNGHLHDVRRRILDALPRRAAISRNNHEFMPHVTLGYWGLRAAAPVIAMVARYRDVEPLHLRVERVRFTVYTREFILPHEDILQTANEDIIAEYVLQGART